MANDPASKYPLGEPSVLDYVRENLFSWRDRTIIPWRVFQVLGFMLVAQMSIEDSIESGGGTRHTGATVLYLMMAILALGLQWVGDLRLAEPPEQIEDADDWQAYWPLLLTGTLLSLAAFYTFRVGTDGFGYDKYAFNVMNVGLWLAGIGFVVRSFWRGNFVFAKFAKWLRALPERLNEGLKITRWGLVVALAFLIGVFYRTHMFGLVMPDMISDHAEKLLDVYDVINGQAKIFFTRNTGREPLQFYLIAWTMKVFRTGFSFTSMKIGTIALGVFSLPYIYLLGKEMGNRRVGLFAMLFAGMAFWPNILARVALRFIFYPAFVAPALFHLIRGLRTGRRNDFILTGLFLGIGLHGYTPFRVVPGLVVIAVLLFVLHVRKLQMQRSAILWLGIVSFVSLLVFLPLARYWQANPAAFNYRWTSRATDIDTEFSDPAWQVFLQNTFDALSMFNVDDGEIWVVSIPHRPALDVVSAGLFVLGAVLLLGRYVRKRHWQDIFLLIAVPFLMLPSIMALAFPAENPAPNRAAGAMVVVFVIVGFAFDAILQAIEDKMGDKLGSRTALIVGTFLLLVSARANYSLLFNDYRIQIEERAWNTAEMGDVVRNFTDTVGSKDQVWVVAYPHWVDTRLVGMEAGFVEKDYALWPDAFESTISIPGPKMFLLKYDDLQDLQALQELYPTGNYNLYQSDRGESRNFYVFFVP